MTPELLKAAEAVLTALAVRELTELREWTVEQDAGSGMQYHELLRDEIDARLAKLRQGGANGS